MLMEMTDFTLRHLGAFKILCIIPEPPGHYLPYDRSRPANIVLIDIEGCNAKAHDVGGTEVADNPAFDERLHGRVSIVEME